MRWTSTRGTALPISSRPHINCEQMSPLRVVELKSSTSASMVRPRPFEAQSHVYTHCTGPADRASVWRNQAAGRLVDPAGPRVSGSVYVCRLFDVGRVPGRAL